MATEKLSWVFELFDAMSAPAVRISKSMREVHKSITGTSGPLKTLTNDTWGFDKGTLSVKDGLTAIAAGAAAAGAAFVALSLSIGKSAFESFAFKEATLATMTALYGSADAADVMFKKAIEVARLTPFNVQQVAGGFAKLGAAGFTQAEVPVVFQAVSDIAALSGRGAEAVGSLTLAMSQIMGRGHLAAGELNQITEAAGGAISATKLFAKISELRGAKTGYDELESKVIDSRTAMMALLQIAKEMGGGVIGQQSIEQSKTLGGLWSNLQDSFTNMWLTMDLSSSSWFKDVKAFLGNLIDALDTSTASGKTLQGVFDRLFGRFTSAFLGEFTGDKGLAEMQTGVTGLALAFEHVMDLGLAGFQGLWQGLKTGLAPLRDMFGIMDSGSNDVEGMRGTMEAVGLALSKIIIGFTALAEAILTVLGAMDRFSATGNVIKDVIGGIADISGIGQVVSGAGRILDASKTGGATAGANADAFFGSIPGYTPGLDANMTSSLGDEVRASAEGRGTAPGEGANVSVALHLDNTGHLDGDAIAQRLQEVLPSTLAGIFDQLAAEHGVA